MEKARRRDLVYFFIVSAIHLFLASGFASPAENSKTRRAADPLIHKEAAAQASDSPRWWESEPLLIFELCMWTLPGRAVGSNWQARTEPAEEVDIVRDSGALQTHLLSVIEGHLTNRYCYFKSKNFKEVRRDYLGDYLRKSKPAGYRTFVYFNVHAVKPAFGNEHPEWRQVRESGKPLDDIYAVETSFCVNSPWRDWVKDVALELCLYPLDGIFLDGPCLFAECCYCSYCQSLYQAQFGSKLPPKKPGHPELRKLASFQSESLRRFLEHINTAIKEKRPDVALYCNAGPREEPYYLIGRNNRELIKSQDILAAEGGFVYGALTTQPEWRVGSNAKYYQAQSGGKPTLVFISPGHGPWRSATLPEAELRLALAQAPLHGSGVWISHFSRFRKEEAFDSMAEDFRFFGKNKGVYFGSKSLARTAIVWPADSVNFYRNPEVLPSGFSKAQPGETVGDIGEEFNGFYDALIKNQVPCDVLDEESVRRGEAGRYDLVILPNVSCTDKAFEEKIRAFVRNGGKVIGSFETSYCDENGVRRKDLGLADVFGVNMLRTPLKPYPHFYFFNQGAQPLLFKGVSSPLLPAPLISCEVALGGARALSPYSRKFLGWDGSEILPSEFPASTINEFGRGKAVYLAGTFGGHYWNYKQVDIRKLLGNLFRELSPPAVEIEDSPLSLEVIHRLSKDQSSETVSLVNYSGGRSRPFEKISRIDNIRINIKTAHSRAIALRLGRELEVKKDGGRLRVLLPYCDEFETVVLKD